MTTKRWGTGSLSVELAWSDAASPRVAAVHRADDLRLEMPVGVPVVEILTVGEGHTLASDRLVTSHVGERLVVTDLRESEDGTWRELRLALRDPHTSLSAELVLETVEGVAAIRSHVVVRNDHPTAPVTLRAVPSWTSYLGHPPGAPAGIADWTLLRGDADWLGEGRWTSRPLASSFPDLAQHHTGHHPRGDLRVVSTGTWSTGKHVPVGVVSSARAGAAWAFQLEHNGPWRYDIGMDDQPWLALSGPTDSDHQWARRLLPGQSHESVPVTVALAGDVQAALAGLTAWRRAARRPHPDNAGMPVVFNDYMNTLDGDPTTDKLLPLVDAAAEIGAEIFCIDAGWYDDSGDWWPTVGEWQPSTRRFPGGLHEVTDRIRQHGMVPGLWLEPEVVGIESPIADKLPDEAFLSRFGERIVEQSRFHLDLRHPAAREHLDAVVDRLVEEFGVGFFKLDYNIDPGPGTDRDADSVGDGLLQHTRAHLDWLDSVLDRHPALVLENCGSGAMRADFAVLSRLQMQSTSDQQEPRLYPPIAAAAPMTMLPEQAASWAYPQPGMDRDLAVSCLVTGLVGRFYVSGHLNEMDAHERALVAEAVAAAKALRDTISRSTPFWPLGLPDWDDGWVCLGLRAPGEILLGVWSRPDPHAPRPGVHLDLGGHLEPGASLEVVFPSAGEGWDVEWDPATATVALTAPPTTSARLLRLRPRPSHA